MPDSHPEIELGRELGAGTTGVVRHGRLRAPFDGLGVGAEVAVKRLRPGAPPAAARALAREARALAAVRGRPHLAELVHAGEDDGGPLVVTRFAPGTSLRELLDEGPLAEARARRLGADLAQALAGLHAAGWWHGDVKPENVRLAADEGALLLDLGFARPVDGPPPEQAGSLPYLSPEQCAGRPGGPGSDVFALGVLLVELATGDVPLAPEAERLGERDAWLSARREAGTFVASSIDPRLSPFFDVLLQDLLAPDPAARPSAARAATRLTGGEAGRWWRDTLARGHVQRSDPRAWLETGRLPLTGRRSELARLGEVYELASGGRSGVVWLEGGEGSGKSRLVAEFVAARRHAPDPPTYLDGRCSQLPDERPGQPLRGLLRRWLHLRRGRPPGSRERALLAEVVPPSTLEVLVAALDPRAEEVPGNEPEALAEALALLGRKGPLVVFLDDLAFADVVTLDGLSRLADKLAGTRMLLVLGLRWGTPAQHPVRMENLRARLATHAPVASLALGALAENEVLELVQVLFHPSVPQLRLARVMIERSGGSPGVLTELLRTLERRGLVRRRGGEAGPLELLVSPEEIPVPGSAARQVVERYEALEPERRAWLRRLAVTGSDLEPTLLTRAFAPGARAEVEQVLADFQAEGLLVVEVEGRQRFARPGQREVVYDLIPEPERIALHAAVARALAQEDRRDRSYQRAYHLHAAGDHAALIALALPLVRRMRDHGHPARVSTLAAWTLDALGVLEPPELRERTRAELFEVAADAADRLGRRDEQRRWLDQLADLDLDPTRDPEAVGRVYLLHGRYAANTGRYGLARGMLRNAVLHFHQAGADQRECDATLRLAHIQGNVGQLEEAGRLARRALKLAVDDVQRARCWLGLADAALVKDAYEEALRLIDRAASRLRQLADPTGGRGALAAAYQQRGRTYRLLGRPRRAYAALQRAVRLAVRAGERRLEAEASARLGRLLLDFDRAREAELVLREALLSCQEIEYRRGQALASVFLGTLLAENGDPEASPMLARTTELAREIGLGRVEALTLALRARIARQAGAREAALALARRAHELLEHFGGELADRVVVTCTLALLLSEDGAQRQARDLENRLRRRVRRVNESIVAPITRQRHHRASRSLLASALSPDGPIYPRVAAELPPDEGSD